MGRKLGGCAPFRGSWVPSNSVDWAEAYLHTKWHLSLSAIWPQRTWAENWRAVLLYGRGAGSPSNTMSPSLWRTSVPSRILMHPAVWPQHTGRKLGGRCAPFFGGGAGSPSSTMWPGLRPTSMPSAILIHPFGRNRHGPKIGGCAPFLGRGSWVPI